MTRESYLQNIADLVNPKLVPSDPLYARFFVKKNAAKLIAHEAKKDFIAWPLFGFFNNQADSSVSSLYQSKNDSSLFMETTEIIYAEYDCHTQTAFYDFQHEEMLLCQPKDNILLLAPMNIELQKSITDKYSFSFLAKYGFA